MRISTIVMIAGSMTAAAPALAQNTAEPTTNADVNAVAPTNETVVITNEMVAPPATVEPTTAPPETATAPAPERRGFPWGVLGLLGLIGLLGKRSRTG